MPDTPATHESIATEARALYNSAKDINSIAEAQEAVRIAAKLIYHLATLGTKPPK